MSLRRLELPITIVISLGCLVFGAANICAQQNKIDSLERVHRSRPNDPAILYDLGVAYTSAGKHDEAATAYEEAIKLAPENPAAYVTLGFSYLATGRNENALAMVRKGAGLMGEDALAYIALGRIFGSLKMYDSALIYFRKGLKHEPNNLEMLRGLAVTASMLKNFPEAIEAWTTIAKLTPNDYEAHFMVGMLYSWSKKYREGIAPLEKALSLKQTSDAYEILGGCHGELHEYKEALAAYQQAVKLNPKDARIRYSLGRCYVYLEDPDKAIPEFNEAIHLDSSLVEVYLNLAGTRANRGEFKEALAIAQAGEKISPEFPGLHGILSGLYGQLNDMENALKELDILRKLDPAQATKIEEQLRRMGKEP